ncbi:SDR family NAD(P)-dependent oxidoreductase [Streptomyces sp. NPDC005438]|uniref:SDR family NAD(P)-dependent oxidoreductase n=1 Tax=Streptomyces sp. NPDC005438 TaxID=3156880 RepID=UPI0033B9E7C0
MTTAQEKIDSGFGYRSTAREVVEGLDLDGTLALVTGGYSGLGLETTRALSAAGAEVIVPARRPEEARRALEGVDRVRVGALDLSDLDSVRGFAEDFLSEGRPLHLTVNNAGVMACPETRVGPGWESQFAINHLGHFALVNRLWPAIAQGRGRVVAVSSAAHHRSDIHWDDLQLTSGYDKWVAYGQSKTANVLFAVGLDALARDSGVRAFSLHPGPIRTELQRHLGLEEMRELGWVDEEGNLINPDFKTPEQGAATQVWAATSPLLDGRGGVYCEDCDIAELSEDGRRGGVRKYAVDPDSATRLWALSAELTGVNAFSG